EFRRTDRLRPHGLRDERSSPVTLGLKPVSISIEDIIIRCWKRARVVHYSQLVMHDMVEGGDICWRKLGLGKLKCNVDEATFVNNGCMGWAAVLRNDKSDFIRCILSFMKRTLDSFLFREALS
ncbi:hypothetical protein Goklo_011178, partial [Gossypium klotzschianum]|nr:hypothetical protein [Gossypium klotzschianum]